MVFFLFIKKFLPSLLPSSSLNSRLKIKGATAVCSLRSFYACFAIFSYNSFDLSLLLLLSCSRSLTRRLPRKHIGWSWDEHNKATYKKSFCYLKHAWYAIRLFFLYFPLLYVFLLYPFFPPLLAIVMFLLLVRVVFFIHFYTVALCSLDERTTTTWVFFVRNFPVICSLP